MGKMGGFREENRCGWGFFVGGFFVGGFLFAFPSPLAPSSGKCILAEYVKSWAK